jgi:hypothetical protein
MMGNVSTSCYIEQVALLFYGVQLVFLAAFVAIVVTLSRSMSGGRAALERFAERQSLAITAGNGNLVLRYLATTRRWRTAGLLAGLTFAVLTGIGGSYSSAERASGGSPYVPLLVGWFLGALAAEVRTAYLAHGEVRAASLRRRRARDYLGTLTWCLVPAAGTLALAVGGWTFSAELTGRASTSWRAWWWLAVSVALTIAVGLTQRRVLRRPQPLAPPDVLAADDAVRSRSLHVLAGGGWALLVLCLWAQLTGVFIDGRPYAHDNDALSLIAGLISLLGVPVATAVWLPRPVAGSSTGPLPGPV